MRYIKNMIAKKKDNCEKTDIGQFGIKGVVEILRIDDLLMKLKRCMTYTQFQSHSGLTSS